MEILKTSATTVPQKLAGAIAGAARNGHDVEVHAVGAGALNQAIKGIAIARGYVSPQGMNLSCTPAFLDVDIEGEKKTGIKLIISR